METLLIATDFSNSAKNASYYAADLAKYFSAKLVLVNAVNLPLGGFDSVQPLEMLSVLKTSAEGALKILKKELIERIGYDPDIICVAEAGSVFEVVSDAATKYSAELIIMGIVGEANKLKEKFIGSSVLSVARDSDLPLFVIPENARYQPIKTISFACDLDHIKDSTLIYSARYFATIFNAELEIVSVSAQGNDSADEKSESIQFIDEHLKNVKHKNVFVKDDSAGEALEYYLKFHKTNMLMIHPKKHKLFESLFEGSVTKHLIFSSETPLLIIH
ncbi:universal stress protein [Aurantibacillus circumpalustris]|uniref:universal stress protein n=1 Tax=Aurantibacillus circumpalustris TaxID=3036359 RepID=UPI00295B3CEE|nr:universal stress protein [Aurantibacillus circumpalustris]